jgi:MFS transporter, SP family, solute carrier family 2 (myo-inositol transporter), member 13
MLLNNLTFIGGAIMCCIANKYILFAGRFLAGFGVGLESVVVPVLLSEIATAETRGTITTLHQVFPYHSLSLLS